MMLATRSRREFSIINMKRRLRLILVGFLLLLPAPPCFCLSSETQPETSTRGLSQEAADYIQASSGATSPSSGDVKVEEEQQPTSTEVAPTSSQPQHQQQHQHQEGDGDAEKPAEAEATTLPSPEDGPSQKQQLVRNRKSPANATSSTDSNEATTKQPPTSSETSNQLQPHQQLDYDDFDLDYQLKLNTSAAGANDPPALTGPGPTLRPPSWSALIRQQPHVFTPTSQLGQQVLTNSSALANSTSTSANNNSPLPSLLTVKSTQLSSQELEQVRPQFLLYPQHDAFEPQTGSQVVADQPNGDLLATATSGSMAMGQALMFNASSVPVLGQPPTANKSASVDSTSSNVTSDVGLNDASEATSQQSKANQWFNYPHPNLHHNPLLLHHILHKPSLYAQHVGANAQQQPSQKSKEDSSSSSGNSNRQLAWRSTTMATPLVGRQVEQLGVANGSERPYAPRSASATQARMLAPTQQTKPAAPLGQLMASSSLLQEIYAPRPTLASANWLPAQQQDSKRQQLMAAKEAMEMLRGQLKSTNSELSNRQVSDEDMSTYVSQLASGFQQQHQSAPSSGLSGAEQALVDQQALQLLQQLKQLNSSLNLNELEQVILRLLEVTSSSSSTTTPASVSASQPNQPQASEQQQPANKLLQQLKTLNPKQQLQLPQPIVGNWHRRPAVHVDPPGNHHQQQHVPAASSLQPTNTSVGDFQYQFQRQQQLLQLAQQERQKQLAFIEALKSSLAAQSGQQRPPGDADLTYVAQRPADERDILALAASAATPTNSTGDANLMSTTTTFDEHISSRPIPEWLERQIVHESLHQRPHKPALLAAHSPLIKPAASSLAQNPGLQLRPQLPASVHANSIQALLQQMQLQQQLHQAHRLLGASATNPTGSTSSSTSGGQDTAGPASPQEPQRILTGTDRFPFASAPAYLIKLPTLTGGTITASGSFAPPSVRLLRPRPLVPLRLLGVPTRLRLVAPANAVHFHQQPALALQAAPSVTHQLRLAHHHHLPHLGHLSHLSHHLHQPHQVLNFRPPLGAHQLYSRQQQQQLAPSHMRPLMSLPPPPPQLQTLPSQSNEQMALVEPMGQHQPIGNTDLASQPARLQLVPLASAPSLNSSAVVQQQQQSNLDSTSNRQLMEQQHESTRAATLSRLQQATASLVELTSLASLVDEMVGADPSPAMTLMQALNSLQQQQQQQNSNLNLNTQASATSQLQTADHGGGSLLASDAPPPFSLKTLLGAGLWHRDRQTLANGARQRDLSAIERIVGAAKRPQSGSGQAARLRVKYIRLPVAVYEPTGTLNGQQGGESGDLQTELVGGGQTTDKEAANSKSTTNSKTPATSAVASSSNDYLFDELSSDSSLQPQLALALRDLAAAGSQHEELRGQEQFLPLALPWATLAKSNRGTSNKYPLDLYHSMMTAASSQHYDLKDHQHHRNHKDRQRKRNKSRQRGKEGEQDYGGEQDEEEAEDHLNQSDLPILESLISTILHGAPSSASPPPPPAMAYGLMAPFAAGYPAPYGPHYMMPWSPLGGHGRTNPYGGLRAESSSLMESYAHPTSGHSLNPFTRHRFSLGEVMGALGARKLISSLLSKGKRARTSSKRTVVAATPSSLQIGSSSSVSHNRGHLFSIKPTTPVPPSMTTTSRHLATTTPMPAASTATAITTTGKSTNQVRWMPAAGGKPQMLDQRQQTTTSTTTRRPVINTFVGRQQVPSPPPLNQLQTNGTTSTTRRPLNLESKDEQIVLRSHQHRPRTNDVQFNFQYLADDSSGSSTGKPGTPTTSAGPPQPKSIRRKEDIMAMPLYHVVADHYSKLYSPTPQLSNFNQRQQQAAPPRLVP